MAKAQTRPPKRGKSTAEFPKPDSSVYVVAQHRLAGFHIAGKQTLHPFFKKCFAKAGVSRDPLEVDGRGPRLG